MKPVVLVIHRPIRPKRRFIYNLIAVIIWLGVWAFTARLIDRELFLPGPAAVLSCFVKLASTSDFWKCVGFSMRNIISGFCFAVLSGLILACLSYMLPFFEVTVSLPLKVVRAVPVASFIILALLWVSSEKLSVLISFLMVLPIMYTGILTGLKSADEKLLEMAAVCRMPLYKQLRRIYIPALLPHLFSALSTGAGLAWKSGVAAEVIGITRHSIGNRLNQARIYFETTELFSWTLAIIIISLLFEALINMAVTRFHSGSI